MKKRREKVREFLPWSRLFRLLIWHANLELVDEGGYDNWNEY